MKDGVITLCSQFLVRQHAVKLPGNQKYESSRCDYYLSWTRLTDILGARSEMKCGAQLSGD